MKHVVEIYTDGACRGNPGPGGWAAVLSAGGREKEVTGAETLTTNNRLALHRFSVREARAAGMAALMEGARLEDCGQEAGQKSGSVGAA